MAELSHQLVARSLRTHILEGRFSDGQQMPTEVGLSAQFHVSRQTVRRAFQDLVAEGLVYRSRGRGTFARAVGDGYVRQDRVIRSLSRWVDRPEIYEFNSFASNR